MALKKLILSPILVLGMLNSCSFFQPRCADEETNAHLKYVENYYRVLDIEYKLSNPLIPSKKIDGFSLGVWEPLKDECTYNTIGMHVLEIDTLEKYKRTYMFFYSFSRDNILSVRSLDRLLEERQVYDTTSRRYKDRIIYTNVENYDTLPIYQGLEFKVSFRDCTIFYNDSIRIITKKL